MSAAWSVLLVLALLSGNVGGTWRRDAQQGPASSDADGSESVGHPFSGHLRGGVRIPVAGERYRVRRTTVARGFVYGVADLVRGVQHTAAALAASSPGADLVVGNLSRKGGGDIPCSLSHNSGRDVDFGLFMLDAQGRSVPSRYYRFDRHGRSMEAGGAYRFDAARNWALVASLLENPHFDVQWLILNPHLERLLLEHARRTGAPPELVGRAERVIDLPRYANLHRNHLHVRILCPESHAACEQGGPVWPWVSRRIAER